MHLTIDEASLNKLIELVTEAVLKRLDERIAGREKTRPPGRKMFVTEGEAADILGVSAWTLKRARLRGEFSAATVSRPILYASENLEAAAEWVRKR